MFAHYIMYIPLIQEVSYKMNKYVLLWNINSLFIIQWPSKKLNIWGSRSKRSDDWVAQFNGAHNKCRFDLDRTTETTSFYKKVVWPSHGSIFHFGCHRSENNKTFFLRNKKNRFEVREVDEIPVLVNHYLVLMVV